MMRGVRRGCVRLNGAIIGIDDEDDSTFTITVDHKTFHFQARNCDERERWVRALEETIARHGRRGAAGPADRTALAAVAARPPRLEMKVAEADALFQIMIDQVKKLDERVNGIADVERKAKCRPIHDQANVMLENIMHSIALLQIAKNTVHPVNGIYTGPTNSSNSAVSAMDSDVDEESWIHVKKTSSVMIPPSTPGIELGSECTERRQSNLQRALTGTSMVLSVPETSYSSSEEDDDFFDASDMEDYPSKIIGVADIHAAIHSHDNSIGMGQFGKAPSFSGQFPSGQPSATTQIISTVSSNAALPLSSSKVVDLPSSLLPSSSVDTADSMGGPSEDLLIQINQHPILPRTKDGKIDYDALYDEDSDNEMDDMESHGSVVTHVLSQVKIGMDLTKVVLPTFILERRSLLEMYADYFAHPEQFLKIVDMPTPQERMVQVVRWYLSSYHAGRKSAVAKKPYNPVLGETFRCHWDALPESAVVEAERNSDTNADVSLNERLEHQDGPIPWCSNNQLTFLAEQVSHHPPISAFYAEHIEKRIQFDAWVWTKSKFLGLSIGVQNIGKGIVTLLDHNEEYTLTFPNGYGRSILTVPWIELGGPVSIECPQTGHRAQIEFITKPFYGGKKHRVTCEIHSPDDNKRPYYTATGEWNSRMEARWTESGRSEVLFDVASMRAHRKRVMAVLKQSERESRRVWRHVTAALRARDVDAATRAKRFVEQAQRDAVREREEQGIVWQTQHFKEQIVEDGWMYMNPLKTRLNRNKLRPSSASASDKSPPTPHIINQR